MKWLIAFCISGMVLASLPGCKKGFGDFLAKPPGVDITIDTIFSSQSQVETCLAGLYYYTLPLDVLTSNDRRRTGSDGSISGATDEAEIMMSWYWPQYWNNGDMKASWPLDRSYTPRWAALRRVNTMLEHIDDAPFDDAGFKSRVKAEAYFLRAYLYHEMFKRYGGVPILNHTLNLGDTLKVGRATVEETVNFIVEDCDRAASVLPNSYPSELKGHATKGAALMLKANTLLFAASPLFNTGDPYLSLGADDPLICYGNYDQQRWQRAADAAKAVLDWAAPNGCHLITDQGIHENYRYVWENPDCAEVILAQKERGPTSPVAYQGYKAFWPASFGGPGGMSVTLNFVKRYEKIDGSPQRWNMNGGDNLTEMYADLDPRFAQSCVYNGGYWNVDHPKLELWEGGRDASGCITGVFLKKPIPTELTNRHPTTPNQIEMRLAEAYLNYAEALNEVQGPVQAAYDAVNKIRSRSGMPDLPAGLSQEEFRERVRHERTIELAFEGHRLWDVRRWLIANTDGIMKGEMWGIKIYKIGEDKFRYEPYVFEIRKFSEPFYLNAFPQEEVDKGYIVQNPEY